MGVYYYKVLGVGHGATDDELKKAYHLGMNYHPNKNPSPQADSLLKQVLSDPQKCAVNDQYGEDSLKADASPPSTPSHGLGAHGFRFNPRSAEEIFSEIFGGTGPRAPVGGVPHGFPGFDSVTGAGEPSSGAAQRKVPPIERWLACSLEDLYKGATKKMKISRDVLDSTGFLEASHSWHTSKGWKHHIADIPVKDGRVVLSAESLKHGVDLLETLQTDPKKKSRKKSLKDGE